MKKGVLIFVAIALYIFANGQSVYTTKVNCGLDEYNSGVLFVSSSNSEYSLIMKDMVHLNYHF